MALQNTTYEQIGSGAVGTKIQGAQAAYTSTSHTFTAAEITNGLITTSNAGATTSTLPLCTDLDTLMANAPTNTSFDFSVINLGAGTVTVTTNTGWTLVGGMAITQNLAFRFRARKTAAGAWTLYQIA